MENNLIQSTALIANKKIDLNPGEYFLEDEGTKINNQTEIKEVKTRQNIQVMRNLQLGQYDSFGLYVISDNIKKELLYNIKKIDSRAGKSYFCSSVNELEEYGKLEFLIETKSLNLKNFSKLFVLEKVKKVDGLVEETKITEVANYSATIDGDYYTKMLDYFNVLNEQAKLSPEKLKELKLERKQQNILRRKKFLDLMRKKTDGEITKAEAKYLTDKIQTLEKMGKPGAEVLAEYEKMKQQYGMNGNSGMGGNGGMFGDGSNSPGGLLDCLDEAAKNIFGDGHGHGHHHGAYGNHNGHDHNNQNGDNIQNPKDAMFNDLKGQVGQFDTTVQGAQNDARQSAAQETNNAIPLTPETSTLQPIQTPSTLQGNATHFETQNNSSNQSKTTVDYVLANETEEDINNGTHFKIGERNAVLYEVGGVRVVKFDENGDGFGEGDKTVIANKELEDIAKKANQNKPKKMSSSNDCENTSVF